MVGFGLVAGIFSLSSLLETVIQQYGLTLNATLDFTTSVLLLGGPILLCAVGAAVSVVMSSRTRTRDVALLIASGARPETLVAAAGFEALIHTATATLAGMAVAAASNAVVAAAVEFPLFSGLAFGEGLVVSIAGFVLVLAATLVPTLSALRKQPALVLAIEE